MAERKWKNFSTINKEGHGTWKRVMINFYNEKTEKNEGVWDENKEEKEHCSLSKIYLLFDAENHILFWKKAKLACEERGSTESIIRYNSYIDRMLIDKIQEMNNDVGKRLQNNIKKLKFLKVEQKNIDDLVRDLITLEIPIKPFLINSSFNHR